MLCSKAAASEKKPAGQLLVREGACFCVSARRYTLFCLIRVVPFPTFFSGFLVETVPCNCDCDCCRCGCCSCFRFANLFSGVSKQDAQVALKGTTSGDKNELLFSRFHTNYNDIPQRFRKGTTLFRARPTAVVAVAPQDAGGRPQQPPPKDDKSANSADKTGGCAPTSEDDTALEGSTDAKEMKISTGQQGEQQGGQQDSEEADARGPKLNLVPAESVGAGSLADKDGKGNPAADVDGGKAQTGMASPHPQLGKGGGEKATVMAIGGEVGRGRTTDKAKVARADSAVVKVVSSGDSKGRTKRLLKKGHAPPGAIEEDAFDLIRDDFWDRNPHILGRFAATRR